MNNQTTSTANESSPQPSSHAVWGLLIGLIFLLAYALWSFARVPAAAAQKLAAPLAPLAATDAPEEPAANPPAAINEVIYSQDFSTPPGPEWSNPLTDTTPFGDPFLGQFSSETTTLSLSNLPTHTAVTLNFSFYALNTWDGINPNYGPDLFEVLVQGGPTLLYSTFSIWDTLDTLWWQTYPDTYPGGIYAGNTGASQIGGQGYYYSAIYDFSFTFFHNENNISIDFSAYGLQEITDESWGIDNVAIEISNEPTDIPITSITAINNSPTPLGEATHLSAIANGYATNFEAGLGEWQATGLWNLLTDSSPCAAAALPVPSETHVVYYGQTTTCNFATGATTTGTLTLLNPITLPGVGTPILSLWSYEQTECGGGINCGYDHRYIEISTDNGASWITLGEGYQENIWYQLTFDLSPYLGNDILLRFRFDSVDDIANEYLGWLIDDVEISQGGVGSGISYAWAFGDGATGNGQNPSHVYPAVGTYTATVTASNTINSLTATTTVDIFETHISVFPTSLEATLSQGEIQSHTLTISNSGASDLVWQIPSGGAPDVLLLHADWDSEYGDSPLQSYLSAYGDLGSIGLFDARDPSGGGSALAGGDKGNGQIAGTPSLSTLLSYDVVVVWSYEYFQDPYGLGDVLADYVDAGGRVIVMMYALDSYAQLFGRFMDQDYTPLRGSSPNYNFACLGSADGNHPITTGITDICDDIRLAGSYLTPGSTALAYWDDGEILAAIKSNLPVVGIAAYPGYYYDWSGQLPDIIHNAILFLSDRWLQVTPANGLTPPAVSTPITITLNATNLLSGTYNTILRVNSNDPDLPQLPVPITMHVLGSPTIVVTPTQLTISPAYVGYPTGEPLLVSNSGTADLLVSAVSAADPTVTVSPTTFIVPPDSAQSVLVTATPIVSGVLTTTLTVSSNAPLSPTRIVTVVVTAVDPPVLVYAPTAIEKTLESGQTQTVTVTISNTGAADLAWSLSRAEIHPSEPPMMFDFAGISPSPALDNNQLPVRKRRAGIFPLAPGDFTLLANSPVPLTCLAVDPNTSFIYAQGNYDTGFYRYDPATDLWTGLASAPLSSGNNGGAAYLNGKIYTVYTNNSTQMGVYDIAGNTWNVISNGLGDGTGNITTDGNRYLYLVSDVVFRRYDTITDIWTDLAAPPTYFELWGALVYLDGFIYGHQGNGEIAFARYDVAANSWTALPSLPDGAVLGGAIDPVDNVYYTYGNYGGNNWYAFDLTTETWSVTTVPFINVDDGGLVHVGASGISGIYIIEGENGTGFARLETSPYFGWLALDPLAGVLSPQAATQVTVTLDATALFSNTYYANILIDGNAPATPRATLPVTMHVTADALPVAVPAQLDFGGMFVGYTSTLPLLIENQGLADLVVTDVTASDPAISTTPVSFATPPLASQSVMVTFSPIVSGTLLGTLTLTTNSALTPLLTVGLSGEALGLPVAHLSPAVISETLISGNSRQVPLLVSNTGESDLAWDLTAVSTVSGTAGMDYVLSSSNEAGGPAFNWMDIAGTGTPIFGLSDDNYVGPFPIGFDFTYFGETYTEFYVGSNGFIGFGPPTYYDDLGNTPLPDSGDPNNIIAWLWDDLHPRAGTIHYQNVAGQLVIQFTNYSWFCCGGDAITAEIILRPTGNILIQYLTFTPSAPLTTNTIGIENQDGSLGLQAAYNQALVQPNLALSFSPRPNWLDLNPANGNTAMDSATPITVTLNATNLLSGTYDAHIQLLSNDPVTPLLTTPLTLTVIGQPHAVITPTLLDFGAGFTGYTRTLTFTVTNTGSEDLRVFDITADSAELAASPTSFVLPLWGGSQVVTVVYGAENAGILTATLTLTTNNPITPILTLPVNGSAIDPPIIAVTPAAVSATLPIHTSRQITLTLANNGGSNLNWVINNGQALQFDGNDYVATGLNIDQGSGSPGLTLEAWAYPTSTSSGRHHIISSDNGGHDWSILHEGGVWYVFTGENARSTGFTVDLNTWQHVAAVFQPGIGVTFYKNDQSVLIPYFSTDTADNNIRIGGNPGFGEYFTGQIDEARVWSGVRTPAQIINNLYIPLNGDEPGLLGYWPCNEGFGPTTADASGHGYTGNIVGATWVATDIPGWVIVEPLNGLLAPLASTPLTLTLDAQYLISGTYPTALHILSNDPAVPRFTLPITLTVIEAGPVDLLASTIVVTPTMAIADGVDTIAISGTLRDGAGLPVSERSIGLQVGGSGNLIAPAPLISSTLEGGISFTLAATGAGPRSLALYDAAYGAALTLTNVTFITPAQPSLAAAPTTLLADGLQTALITVTLRNTAGDPLPGEIVSLRFLSGTYSLLNGVVVTGANWIDIGAADVGGVATATLASTRAEVKHLAARGETVSAPETVTVTFLADTAMQAQLLLPGETATPGILPGQAGTPAAVTAGAPFTFTLQAVDAYWNPVPITGTLQLTVSDPLADMPATVDLVAGTAMVSATLRLAGSHVITATPTNQPWPVAMSQPLPVQAAPATSLTLDILSSTQLLDPVDAAVTLYDPFGNVAGSYTGQVLFSSSDAQATLPTPYTFAPTDGGAHTFSGGIRFRTPGPQTITVTDSVQPSLLATATLTVSDQVVISNDTTWNESAVALDSLTVLNNAILTLQGATTITANNVIIDTGAAISANGQGYGAAAGPGAGENGGGPWNQAGGAGHGGWGGAAEHPGGAPYDKVYQPRESGSGGGSSGGNAGGAGGGAIHLVVADTLTISGTLSSNGLSAGYGGFDAGGGGAGGAIWLDANTLTGGGSIQASGGDGGTTSLGNAYGRGGGGAGGRVAVYAGIDDYTGAFQLHGGGGSQYGGPGTLYRQNQDLLRVDNAGHNGQSAGLLTGAYHFTAIQLTGYGHLHLPDPGSILTLTNGTAGGDGTARLSSSGLVIGDADMLISGVTLAIQGDLLGANSITTQSSGGLELSASTPWRSGVYTFTTVTIGGGTTLKAVNYNNGNTDYNDDYGLTLVASELTIAEGAAFTADGQGYGSTSGPGAGAPGGGPWDQAGGGGHGGWGHNAEHPGGAPYGDLYQPLDLGSGGGYSGGRAGGAGGGAVHLIVANTLAISGTLSSNGISGGFGGFDGAGGGSGGSLWIEAGVLQGGGSIRANGGDGGTTTLGNAYGRGGGGGGGRIAVYAAVDTFTGSYSVNAGDAGTCPAVCLGTLYFNGIDPLNSSLILAPDALVADGVSAATITVTLRARDGAPLAGEGVELRATPGNNAHINGQPAVGYVYVGDSDSNGVVTAVITSTKVGLHVLDARGLRGELLQQTATVTFTVGPVDADASQLTTNKSNVIADGLDAATLTVTLTDAQANPLAGEEVHLQATGVDITVTQPVTLTDAAGQLQATVRSTTAQSSQVTALVVGEGITLTDVVNLSFTPAPANAANSTIIITPTQAAANGSSVITITATLRDILNRPLANRAIQIQVTGNNNVIHPSTTQNTDATGQVAFTLASSTAQAKQISLRDLVGNVTLVGGTVTFLPTPLDPNRSDINILGARTAAADGQHALTLIATARDANGNAIPDLPVVFTTNAPVNLAQPNYPTDPSGRALGSVSSSEIGAFTIGVTIDGLALNKTVTVSFIGPDLHVTQSGPAQATVGYPLAYDVTVKNEGLMPASTTLISDTLPNYTTFVTQTSPYPFTYYTTTRTIVWQVGPLPVGQSANLHLETLVDNNAPLNSTVYNTVVAQAAEPELDTADNTASSPTVLKAPQPNMVISSLYPSLVVPEGLTRTLVLTISNEGTANLISATILPPPHLPWVTVTPQQLGNLAPGDVVTATIIADASQVGVNGHYRDRLQVTTANAGTQNVFLTAQVQAPLRNLHLQLSNDLGQNVINAHVILVETIYVETEGVPGSSSYYYENDTDATGQITFNSLETGQAYEYTITAASHDAANGYVYVETGANAQEWSLVLQGQPGLRLEPAAITFNMYRGELAQQILTIRNTGAAPLSDISLAMQNIPFIYLGEPAVGTVLNPGQAVEVTVNAAPPITETIDIYQGTLTVDASGGQSQSIPVTVNIRDQLARTLCARVETDSGAPLTQATLRLTDLAGKIIATGPITDTIQQAYVQSSDQDGPGYSCFADLTPGPYYLEVGRGDILLGDKNIAVVPGDGIQEELIIVDEPAVIAKWSVTPTEIEDVYTTVFTLTFIPHQVPRLSFSPDRINLCGDDDGVVTQEITVHNFYPITLTNAVLTWQTQGNVSASVSGPNGPTGGGSIGIGELPPNSHTPFLLTVSTDMQTCSGDEGLVLINVEAEYQHFIPETWYRIDATPGLVQPGQQAHIPLKLVNTGYPEESNLNGIPPTMEDITIVPPQNLNWITVSTTLIDSLEVGEEIGFDLIVEPPQWLAEGFYYDYIQIYATNGITTLIGIEAEMTPGGLRVETQFVTPLTAGEGGAPPPPPPGEPPPQYGQETPPWDDIVTQWNPDIFGPNEVIVGNWQILVGCYCAQPVGEWYPVGNALVHVVTGAPGPGFAFSPDFKENVVILQLEQRFSLDRQAFTADLDLGNGLASELTDVEVSIVFQNGQGEIVPVRLPEDPITPTGDFTPTLPLTSIVPAENLLDGTPGRWQKIYPANFIIVPETPTALPNLPSGQNYFASWTIIPDAPGLTELGYFDVYAIIRYKVNGVQKELITSPAPITVEPQPRIVLDYYLPNYVLGSQTFDWLVVATNIGYGTARNFRVETPQPKIIKQSEVYPTNFTLIGPSVLNWGDVAPGQQVSGVWRLLPSEPGSFVDWEAECKHDDYKGVELPELVYCTPRVHFYDTSYLAESQQWGKGDSCLSGLFQGFDSDPVNTFSGNFTYSTSDVNIPSWGPALELVRSYNSRDTEDGPFGPGWTHNFNLDLTYESFIGLDQDGIIGQQTYFAARLPHGSIIYFNVSPDGNTITPFPGVKATLTRELTTYTLTQACDQTVYTYNAEQKLTSVEDPNGNRLTMSYDQNGNLTAVTDDTGRPLTFTYDANGHVTQMTDPLGRSYTYSYSLGYLAQVEDFRGQVTHYTYSLPTPRQPGQLVSRIDPNGHQEFVNHYDENYRLDWQDDALGNRTLFGYNYDANNDTRTTLVTDPLGNTSTDRYDSEGRLISRHDALGNAETYGYDNAYNVNRVTDANGHTTLYDWDDCNCNITQLVDPMGNTTTMTVNGQKLVTSVTNERGYTTSMAYDSHTNRLAVTDPLGGTKSYTYGPHGETLSETDENGHTAWFGYDAFGNTTVITDALGQTTRMAYDVAGRLLQMTDALGRTTTYVYDAGDNVLQTTNGISATTVFAYDNAGNLLSITDPLGRNVSYEYDPRNDLIRTTNPLGGVQTYAYDANGNLITQANANGRATTHTYDPLNRRIQTTNPLSGTVSSVYDPVGNLLAETDANGNVTQYVYDANDRVVRTIFPDGSEMTSLYDQADNLLQLTNGAGGSVSFTYDALGRTLTKTDPELGVASYVYDPAGNQIHMTDAEGRQTSYTYDALNRLVSVTDPAGYITSFGYDAVGNQTGATDGNGHTMTIVYDDANRIVQRIDPRGGITRYSYDLVGNRTRVVNPLGSATRTSYDALNRPLTVTNALSGTVSYLYDGVGNILQVTDEEGNTRQYAYDALDRKVSMTDALGGVTTMAYDANGNLLTQTDPLGRTTQFAYDVFNQVLTRTNPLGGTTVYVYDAVGNVLQATNPNGQATQFSYDGLDRMIAAIDANAGITLYAYDKVGNLTQQTDPEGNAVATAYDLLNRPVAVTDALGHASSYAYDAVGNLIRMTDAEGRQTTYAYDELNRLVQLTDPLGQVTQYAYDAIGNQVSLVDALGRESTFAFDKLNRLVRATNSISGTTVYTYTAAGNLHAAADANGQQTTYIYDTLYRPIHTIDPLGQVLTTTYDAVGNPLAITDVAGRTTQFTYDGLNRLVQAVNPLGGVQTMAYDPIGNRIQSSDENGHAIHYSYDALNRLVAITDPLAHLTTFTYDRVGNQLTLTDPLSRTTGYAYDAAYRLLTITDPLGQQSSYSYDAVGNILASADAAGRTTQFTYDGLNRVIQMTNPLSGTMQFTYDAVGNQTSVTDAAGHVIAYAYDGMDRLTRITNPLNQVTSYAYDPLGNLLAQTDALNRTTRYDYDALNRMVMVTDPLSATMQFEYDPVGNMVRQVDRLQNPTQYTVDALNRVVAMTDALNQTTSFAYDPVGNLLQVTNANGATSQMAYDALNRLVSQTNPLGHTTQYSYDAIGNNTAVIDPLGHQTSFVYDPLDRMIGVTDALNRTTGYLYDPVGNQVGMTDAEGVETRYQYDALNRLTQVTENYVSGGPQDAETNVVNQFSYDPVGNLIAATNPLGNSFTYSYDALNRMVQAADPLGYVTQYNYDPVGNLAGVMDPNQTQTSYVYDDLNRLTTITRPDETVSFTYDAMGNRLTMSDLTGLTSYSYDAIYRLTVVTDPLLQTVQYGYDSAGNRTSLTYPDDEQVTYGYDGANRLLTVTDWDGGETSYTYDEAARLVEVVLPNGITGTFGYDDANQLTLIQYNSLTQTLGSYVYAYDQAGNRIQVVELQVAAENVPTAVFTATERVGVAPLTVTFYNGSIYADTFVWEFGDGQTLTTTSMLPLTHTYDQPGLYTVRLTAANADYSHTLEQSDYVLALAADVFQESGGQVVMEAEHAHAIIVRGGQTWITRTALAGYVGESYLQVLPDRGALYATDYLTRSPELQYQVYFSTPGDYVVWGAGAAVNAGSDSLHIGINGTPALSLTGFPWQQWGWTNQTTTGLTATLNIPAPGLYTITLWAREDGLRFDRLLLTQDTDYVPTGSGPGESPRVGDVPLAQLTPPPSRVATWFTANSRHVAAAAQQQRNWLQIAATILGNPGLLFLGPLGLLAPLAYSRRKRRRLIRALTGATIALALIGFGWALTTGAGMNLAEAVDLPRSYLNPLTPASLTGDQATTHQSLRGLAQTSATTIQYEYDPLYRLTAATYSSGESYGYSYDAGSNRLLEARNGQPIASYTYDIANRLVQLDGQTLTYDANGNLLTDGQFNYVYDTANRLTQISSGVSTAQYVYNGDGHRVAQILDGVRTDYVQDVARALPQVLTARQGGTTSRYLRGLGLIGEQHGGTGPFADPPTWQYTLADALGSIRQVTNGQGKVTLSQDFDPFGAVMSSNGVAASAYGFTGEEQDPLTGLIYLRARTYNPATGRFLQQDSVFGDPTHPRTLHRYAYGFNNPVNYTDPSGNMPDGGRSAGSQALPGARHGTPDGQQHGSNVRTPGGRGGGSGGQSERRHGSGLCGFLADVVTTVADIATELIDLGGNVVDAAESLWDFVQTGDPESLFDAYDSIKAAGDNAVNIYNQAADFVERNEAVFTALLQVAIGFIPYVGTLYDIASLALGYDLLTGEPLTDFEKGLMIAGLFLGGLDELGGLFKGGLKYGDELVDGFRSADELGDLHNLDELGDLRHADELGGLRGVDSVADDFRYVDELQDFRHVDEFDSAARPVTYGGSPSKSVPIASDFVDDGRRIGRSDLAPDFYSVPNNGGGRVWVSDKPISQADFADLVNTKNAGGEVHVLTGTHGDQLGNLIPEKAFYDEDLARWGSTPDVTVSDITKMTPAEIEQAVNGPGRVVCAWCYSERSQDVLPGLGHTSCANSFVAGTLVSTEPGMQSIEDISIGDRVLAQAPQTEQQAYEAVTARTNHPTNDLVKLTLQYTDASARDDQRLDSPSSKSFGPDGQAAQDVILVTPDHPLYIEGAGWMPAENLALGDRLRRADGGWTKVLAIERLKQGPLQHGYDFVEGPFVVNHKVARNPNLNHRSLIPRGHQISIHTQKAVGAFNRYIVRP